MNLLEKNNVRPEQLEPAESSVAPVVKDYGDTGLTFEDMAQAISELAEIVGELNG